MSIKYEAVIHLRSNSDRPPDIDIKIVGAREGTSKTATVFGGYGKDAQKTADIMFNALNRGNI